jgi:hypothetical protein
MTGPDHGPELLTPLSPFTRVACGSESMENSIPTVADLYARYVKKVNNLAYRMTGDRTVADDITHETFVRVCQK